MAPVEHCILLLSQLTLDGWDTLELGKGFFFQARDILVAFQSADLQAELTIGKWLLSINRTDSQFTW